MPGVPVAGELRHRIQIQSSTLTVDNYGQPIRNWSTFATVWAKVESAGGGESPVAGQTQSQVRRTITIRNNESILPDQQVIWRTRTLKIVSVYDPWGTRTWMVLDCIDREIGEQTQAPDE